ncbi:MAG: RNA dependent RNA polymerase, partial [Lachnospiraceae bacterium]|nr:RNA dependent RNA polymerase [Lachnospiraceae bacterium]
MLEKQVMIYSVDTGDFYSKREAYLHNLNHKLRRERNQLINGTEIRNSKTKKKRTIVGLKYIEKAILSSGIEKETLKLIEKGEKQPFDYSIDIENNIKEYLRLKKLISLKNQKIKNSKEILLLLLSNKVEVNIKQNGKHHIRTLNESCISDKKIISVFESAFTRIIKAFPDELSEDFLVVQVFYFSVIKDLIYNGFEYKGEKYIYFTSSAGQIRTKKCVFVKECVWKKYEKTLMCGLTIDDINKNGGINTNKYLAYMALSNSATDEWKEFDIDKTIVIDDFETNVFGIVDFIDDKDYSITRKADYFNICHTDGCGMILPNAFGRNQKNMMIRLPFVKGLISPFPFDRFIKENGCSSIIKDIYGTEHDIINEDIQVIFTKSQFKLAKYYTNWQEYKDNFKKYHCSAGYTNIESNRIKNTTINYQMLQSLVDISDEEILAISDSSVKKLKTLCDSVQNIKNVFGITPYNQNKTSLQKAIEIYPELLNDVYIRSKLKDIKDSLIKKYKSGKLQVNGKYTFILPDLYAACEYWFLKNDNPQGLLNDGEVFCWLFRQDNELDCLRSPHLYMEHAVRKNVVNAEIREWFNTNALYTSCH